MTGQSWTAVWNVLRAFRRGRESQQLPNGVGAMATVPDQQPDVVIVTNDLTDSDNWTAARLLQQLRLDGLLKCRIVWIVEPRQVLFGAPMTEDEQRKCRKLIEEHFAAYIKECFPPEEKNPSLKILLRGSLTQKQIDAIDPERLSTSDRELLSRAVKPAPGPKEDALRHARLMSYDLLEFLRLSPGGVKDDGVDIYVDEDTLDSITMPVNLNVHHPEELISRSPDELKRREEINKMPAGQRETELRTWYEKCAETQRRNCEDKEIQPLKVSLLAKTIRDAERPLYLGGSSMRLLQRLLKKRNVTKKLTCCFQAGAFDLTKNLFSNQFNIAMNPEAAKAVLTNVEQFKKFYAVPTDTTLRVKYSLSGLGDHDRALERRCLGFNCHVDPEKLATDDIRLSSHFPDKKVVMADLTAFLCALHSFLPLRHGIQPAQASHSGASVDERCVLKLDAEKGKIEAYDIPETLELELVDVLFKQRGNG